MEGSNTAVTATKIAPPRPPSRHLHRTRLIERLEESVNAGGTVVLASAPAGSGKSTLVNTWLDRRSVKVGWLQIDEGDDDPSRFWVGLAAAVHGGVPAVAEVITTTISDGTDAVVAAMVNAIAESGAEIALVLDDYHLVSNPEVHRGVEQLITRRPANLIVVVSTRVDPPFRLGRLRVRGELSEIRAADLRFERDESAWLLDAETLGLDRDAVEQLTTRTEGWAAGLVLAALSLHRVADVAEFVDSFRGDDHLVADYLSDEFLDAIEPNERQRLLEVAVLDQLSGSLIDDVCGTSDGAAWLTSLAAGNQLVISLDRSGTWFRFHHLPRDLLRIELERTSPKRAAVLHANADGGTPQRVTWWLRSTISSRPAARSRPPTSWPRTPPSC
ncbi:MAG: hypothetical protein R2733_06455 [Acidimicrobiales bacterium]